MDVLGYFTDNFVMIFELVGLLIMLAISVHVPGRIKLLTRVIVALLFAESLAFYLEKWTQGFETLSILRPLLTSVVYSLYPVILLVLLQVTTKGRVSRKTMLLLLLPEIIAVPVYFTSQWTHLVCWFTESNRYQGGVLSFLPYAVFIFYSVVFAVANIMYFRGISRMNRLASTYIVIVPMLGMFFYRLFAQGKDYSALFSAAILLYFIMIYIHIAKTDPLTSLLNRLSYDIATRKNVTGVVSVDMNGLKQLNDSEGHDAGDEALRTVAEILRTNAGSGASVYRVGGDEFVILYESTDEKGITEAIEVMREQLNGTRYTCSFGHAMVRPGISLSDTVSESDTNMYAEKAAYYSAPGADRRRNGS